MNDKSEYSQSFLGPIRSRFYKLRTMVGVCLDRLHDAHHGVEYATINFAAEVDILSISCSPFVERAVDLFPTSSVSSRDGMELTAVAAKATARRGTSRLNFDGYRAAILLLPR